MRMPSSQGAGPTTPWFDAIGTYLLAQPHRWLMVPLATTPIGDPTRSADIRRDMARRMNSRGTPVQTQVDANHIYVRLR